MRKPVRLGIAGPVGSGKTTLLIQLCRELGQRYSIAAIINDIFTQEDAEIVARSGAIDSDRIIGVETGGCPHTAIREDVSMNLPHGLPVALRRSEAIAADRLGPRRWRAERRLLAHASFADAVVRALGVLALGGGGGRDGQR